MVFMGIVGVFLVCHILRITLNIHEMIVIEHAMACSKAHQRSFPSPPYQLGDKFARLSDGSVMVYVPAGTFEMGSLPDSDDWGPHTVTLDDFWIDQTEVTNAQFVAFMKIWGNPVEHGMTWIEVEMIEDAQIMLVGTEFQPDPGKQDHPVVVTGPTAPSDRAQATSDERTS